MPTTLKKDPTQTTMLRARFVRDMNKRFALISRAVRELLIDDDAFGLKPAPTLQFNIVERQVWRFQSDAQKVTSFRRWLQEQINEKVLISDAVGGKPWLAPYIESSYKKGLTKSYQQVYGDLLETPEALRTMPNGNILGVSFQGAEQTKRIEAIYTRAWNDLTGVTAAMGQKLSRHLSLGLAQGDNPRVIARRMTKDITGLTRTRARMIARTEVIAAHAEGQLDAYEDLAIDEVTIQAEWLTAGDDRVCGMCQPMEGEILKLEEARGLIPRHPNCRCAWVPVPNRPKTPQADLNKSLAESIDAERVKGSLLSKKKRSSWAGKELLKAKLPTPVKKKAVKKVAKKKAVKKVQPFHKPRGGGATQRLRDEIAAKKPPTKAPPTREAFEKQLDALYASRPWGKGQWAAERARLQDEFNKAVAAATKKPIATKTIKLQKDLDAATAKRLAAEKKLATQTKELKETKKKLAAVEKRNKEIAELKRKLAQEKAVVKKLDKKLAAQDRARDAGKKPKIDTTVRKAPDPERVTYIKKFSHVDDETADLMGRLEASFPTKSSRGHPTLVRPNIGGGKDSVGMFKGGGAEVPWSKLHKQVEGITDEIYRLRAGNKYIGKNAIDEALSQVQTLNITNSEYGWLLKKENINAVGVFDSSRGKLVLGLNNSTKTKPFKLGGFQYSVDGSTTGIFRHEMGHGLQFSLAAEKKAEFQSIWKAYTKGGNLTIQDNIGRYAYTNDMELFAESFAAYTHKDYGLGGKLLPKKLHDFFFDLLGSDL